MNINEQQLLNLMRYFHVGKDRAIKKRELLREIFGLEAAHDESYNNPFDRKLREMIEHLNHDCGALIFSSSDAGYFWASSLDEGLHALEEPERRARTQLDNVNHLKHNLQRIFGGQMKMGI